MGWLKKYSIHILFFAPIVFAVLYGLEGLVENEYLSFVLTSVFGIGLSLSGAALFQEAKTWSGKITLGYRDVINEKVGHIPSDDYLNKVFGPLPPVFLKYLSEERRNVTESFDRLKFESKWQLSTARVYEAIKNTMEKAKVVNIIDHDIRRWYEILFSPSDLTIINTSTTFNYSMEILGVTNKKICRCNTVKDYRRLFVVREDYIKQLKYEISNNIPLTWEFIDNQVKVLLKIWDFEQRLLAKRKKINLPEIKHFGSRVIVANELPKYMNTSLNLFKDIVLIENQICFQESLLVVQDTSSDNTESFVIVKDTFLEEATDFFNELWSYEKAIKPEDFDLTPYFKEINNQINI